MADRVLRVFDEEDDIKKIADTFHTWQRTDAFEDVPGFCASKDLAAIEKHDFVLTPGRYVGAAAQEEDDETFSHKMARLTAQLKGQFEESDRLETEIKRNLGGLGYEC